MAYYDVKRVEKNTRFTKCKKGRSNGNGKEKRNEDERRIQREKS